MAAGLLLFVSGELYQHYSDVHHIVITPEREARLANQYTLQFGTAPEARTLNGLVDADVHDEILFREALALGLDKDDEIVRRRLVQKMQFLLEDLRAPQRPEAQQLDAYYRAHADRYAQPASVTFSHIYFSTDHGAEAARQRAVQVLHKLTAAIDRAPQLGDPFPDSYDFSGYGREQTERLFGHSELSEAIWTAPQGTWAGPFRSAYGWHLVFVESRARSERVPLTAVRDAVNSDYLRDHRAQTNRRAFQELARQFTVTHPKAAP